MILAMQKENGVIVLPGKASDFRMVPDIVNMNARGLMDYPNPFNTSRSNDFAGNSKYWFQNARNGEELLSAGVPEKTAIICGAGFGLDYYLQSDDFDWSEYTIFGINRACSLVDCHFNVSIDPNCQPDFYNGKNNLISVMISNPEVGRKYGPDCSFVFQTNTTAQYVDYKPEYPLMYSGTNSMQFTLHVAYSMGYRQFKLIGTNFARKPKGSYYAAGQDIKGPDGGEIPIIDQGQQLITTGNLVKHARGVAAVIYWLKRAGCKFDRPYGALGRYMDLIDRL